MEARRSSSNTPPSYECVPVMSPPPHARSNDDADEEARTPLITRTSTIPSRSRSTPASNSSVYRSLSSPPLIPASCYDSPLQTTQNPSVYNRPPTPSLLPSIKRRNSSITAAVGNLRSQHLKSFIADLLHRDPSKRPTIAQLLAHPNIQYALQRREANISLIDQKNPS